MVLAAYRAKRNFSATPEPKGRKSAKSGASFVVQKHDATRLHYDFRLELDGALKSWAVTRGPSLVPGEKRLAVHVEDHPLEYGDFEGTIPKGEYGGGTVIVWDRGAWTPLGDARKGYAKGHLEFELHGEKLHGRWHLVKMHGKPSEKRENWLLIKAEDEYAQSDSAPDILEARPDSVKTHRNLAEVAEGAPKAAAKPRGRGRGPAPEASPPKGAKKGPLPSFVEPMLATLAASPPPGERWLHEIKFDGYRLQARIEAGKVKLLTRGGLDWTKKFGADLPAAFARLPTHTALIDGELVVETASGASDFSALQADLSDGRADRFVFYAFDLLYLDGYDLRNAPLVERKQRLETLIGKAGGAIRFSGHFDEAGAMVLSHACRLGLEGVVSKLRDSPYRAGRGKNWIKSKCSSRQEFVIGGFTPSTTGSRAIGALALGIHDGDALRYVGRVGTGFTQRVAEDLFKKLDGLTVRKSPFDEALSAEEKHGVRFVRPELVAEVEFRAWTGDAHLRHASFRGLREDKPAREIVREAPVSAPKAKEARRNVKLTHPDRLYWPEQGITKEGLADYYAEVWRSIAPFVVGRPLALLRCPTGIDGQKFFQKHAWKGLSPTIKLVKDPEAPSDEPMISIDSLDGLLGLVQAAVLEIHPWGSTLANWESPDTITLDLDPGEGVGWEAIIAAAEEAKQRLEASGLAAFVKTTGGKGLHVVAPLKPKAKWPAVKDFTRKIAESMAADSPDRFVATITKSKRKGKILVDYLRNQRGATAVAAYSTRARPGASVSMPIAWNELGPAIRSNTFTIENTPQRLASLKADPWEDFRAAAAPLENAPRRRKKPA
jgi:bifunctional non-homologous end joining protein LigD